ncbi:MAG: hypothetical protein V3U76_19435 [Granulosicoccus sp.]
MFNFKTLTTAAVIVMLSFGGAQATAADSTSKLLTRSDLVTVEGSIYLVSRQQGRVVFNVNPKIGAPVAADQALSQDYLVPGTGIWFTSRDNGSTSFDVLYPVDLS